MITRDEILKSPEYWFEQAQSELFRQVHEYMEKENLNQTQLAEKLGVTKGYVSQILKGEFNYTLKKLIEISLAIGKVPVLEYKSVSEILEVDKQVVYFNSLDSVLEVKHMAPSNANTTEKAPIEATGSLKLVVG